MFRSILVLIAILMAYNVSAFASTKKAPPLALKSISTSLDPKDCITMQFSETDPEAEIDFYSAECPGFGGYRVYVSGSDLRYKVWLEYENTELRLSDIVSFHDLGSFKLEWFYQKTVEGQIQYRALIHRLNVMHPTGVDDAANESLLIVTRLNGKKTCTVGIVKPSAQQNAQARDIAARAHTLPCIVK